MKITCADCKTVYNISDDRIPEQGIDTVCKKCGKALHLAKNSQNAENPHRLAEIIQTSEINQNAENSQPETVQEILLTPCSQCAKEIRPDAKTCPHCGAKVRSGIFGKMKKQAGELTEMAKEKAGGLTEMTKEAVKHVDKEQLKELAKRGSEIAAKHSGKIDRLLRFSFRFGKLVSAFFIFLFFLLFVSGIAYYFVAGNAGFRTPAFEDVRSVLEDRGKSYSSHDFSEIDRKRKMENTYGDTVKKMIIAYQFSEGNYDVMMKWILAVPDEFQKKFIRHGRFSERHGKMGEKKQ